MDMDVMDVTHKKIGGKGRTDGSRCDIKITGPYHGFLLVQITDVGFEMMIPQFLCIESLQQ
jgi:hypothetical protein